LDIALRGLHVALGELALLFIIWMLVEVAWGPIKGGVLRAKIASLTGTILVFLHWVVSGWYYVVYYSPDVKPAIKAGSWSWAHLIVMESKEHIFLFIPFLMFLLLFLVWKYGGKLKEERGLRFSIFALGAVVLAIFGLMILSGFLISSAHRISVG